MSLKEDVKELEDNINELAEEQEKHSFAYELLQDAKKTIRGLEVANILLIIALIIAIIF
jgi:hypothetical protein